MWSFNGSNWISRTDNVSYTPIYERDPVYGSPGVFSSATHPGSRSLSTCWKMRVRRDLQRAWEDPNNWRDLFFLYGGVSTWTGSSFVGSDLFVFDPLLGQWAFLTGPTPPNAALSAPFSSGAQYPVRLVRSVPVFSSDYPTELVQIQVSGVWRNLVPVYDSAGEFSWGSADFLFNIRSWRWEDNVNGILTCFKRCLNAPFTALSSTRSAIDARFYQPTIHQYTSHPIA
eukprot:TRINITY_DN12988_c0_g1_i1.p1 TRINITY_DN12988_c0_g1~~TRINITY_DN12988_c0_g1_i1.p1  ORF type:complete len:228 (-),score=2.11 TRINITY_DN12988_c0_g1_i1:33-716(-)